MLQQVRAGLGNRGGCPILPPPLHSSGPAQPAPPAQTWWDSPRGWKPPKDPLPGVTREHHPPWPGPLSGAHICFCGPLPSRPPLFAILTSLGPYFPRSLLPLSSGCCSNSLKSEAPGFSPLILYGSLGELPNLLVYPVGEMV